MNAFKHNETWKNDRVLYYLINKFTLYEARYTIFDRMCCSLTLIAQKIEKIFMFLYHISHFQDGRVEVYFSKSNADRKTKKLVNTFERI